LKVMQNMAVIDAVVVVSRWFGGTLLGPARFQHIETCATEVCKAFKRTEELQDCVTTLRMLDDVLGERRKKLQAFKDKTASNADSPSILSTTPTDELGAPSQTTPKVVDYSKLDISKAKRLINARESSIKYVTALVEKEQLLAQPHTFSLI